MSSEFYIDFLQIHSDLFPNVSQILRNILYKMVNSLSKGLLYGLFKKRHLLAHRQFSWRI